MARGPRATKESSRSLEEKVPVSNSSEEEEVEREVNVNDQVGEEDAEELEAVERTADYSDEEENDAAANHGGGELDDEEERMACKWGLVVAILISLCAISTGRELKVKTKHKDHQPVYSHTLARVLAEYASAVYVSDTTQLFTWTCERCNDLTEGFEMIELIIDVQCCLQAFVGVAKDLNAIVIAFRGTQGTSIQNWVTDLYWKQLDINYPGMDNAMVHHGFYAAYHNTTLRPGILSAVERAKELYGDIKIMLTGHSMGGAMAAFCALDLTVNIGEKDVQAVTFGQPRIGNAAFASYYSKFVPNTIRVTHEHDIVPHLPPYYYHFPQKTYHHFPREVWLYDIDLRSLVYTVEKVCDGSGEDPTCSRSVVGNSILDHLAYYGIQMGCEEGGSCSTIMDPSSVAYRTMDIEGNFVLSRNLSFDSLRRSSEVKGQVDSM
ncbi:lipase-like isoform X2 [Coffea eugenioides]|uniref:lipase-like isoform X1 n=1 Tax=Coffea eugenioides TaxID=49369 RepID=UPI000F6078B4|nr:lipase-like isoform X1 [Coffea eugenioides]XP_027151095.1 lipase-like isoform X2 [Coffea eugenioides]